MEQTTATVKIGTRVVFTWAGYRGLSHNVYMLPNKADFENCTFANAQELAKNHQNPFTYTPSSTGTFYFACQVGAGAHCNTTQKLALTVIGKLTVKMLLSSTYKGKPSDSYFTTENQTLHIRKLAFLNACRCEQHRERVLDEQWWLP